MKNSMAQSNQLQRVEPNSVIPKAARQELDRFKSLFPDSHDGKGAAAFAERILIDHGDWDPVRKRYCWTTACDEALRTMALSYAAFRMSDPDIGTANTNTVLKHVTPPPVQRHIHEISPANNEVDERFTRLLVQQGFTEEQARDIVAAAVARDYSGILKDVRVREAMHAALTSGQEEP